MKYKKYPSYKESGIEWLGEIPSEWSLIRGKFLFKNMKKSNHSLLENTRLALTLKGVIERNKEDVEGLQPEKFNTYQIFEKNDLVFKLIDLENKQTSRVGLVHKRGIMSPAYIRLIKNSNIVIKYTYYVYFRLYIEYIFNSLGGNGVRSALNANDLLEIPLNIPNSIKEQTQIANFLDRATKKIDTLIDKQKRLIELLKEKRQALISHTVTKGLNQNVEFKESGIEWLGEIPRHWKLPKIKWFTKTDSGSTPNTTKHNEYYRNGIYPWIRTTDLNNSELFTTPISITEEAIKDTACSIIPINSILIGMYGGAGTIGKHSLLKFEATINQAICAITPNRKCNPKYLYYFVKYYRPYWMVSAEGTRKDPNIGQDRIKETHITLPPLKEQKQIVEYLDDKTAKIDKLIEKANKSIELLKEKRQTLISATVTGKIDVREVEI